MGQAYCRCDSGHYHLTLDEVRECHEQTIRKTQFKCHQGHYHQNESEVAKCNEKELKLVQNKTKENHVLYRYITKDGDTYEFEGTPSDAPKIFRSNTLA